MGGATYYQSKEKRAAPGGEVRLFYKTSYDSSERFLRRKFEQVGEIANFDYWRRGDGSFMGMGVVEFKSADSAQLAMQELDGKQIDNFKVHVSMDSPAPSGGPFLG